MRMRTSGATTSADASRMIIFMITPQPTAYLPKLQRQMIIA